MSDQARVSNGLLWVFIVLYVLMGASRLLHNPHLQRLMPFISVAILMGFAIVHGIRRYGWRHFVVFFYRRLRYQLELRDLEHPDRIPIRSLRLH